MSNPWVVALVTASLIAASAFFVAVEFALIAARRHRLEDAAPHSRSARAALRSASELSVLLAGSQLGITICTLALGAITKPAVHHWLTPAIAGWGAPSWLADVGGFVLALIIVTFLHLVVGEMAPKSWAIAHPERSATMLALPMRAFMWVTRPVIGTLNRLANWCLRKVGVEPVDAAGLGDIGDRCGSPSSRAADIDGPPVRDRHQPGLHIGVGIEIRIATHRREECLRPGVLGVDGTEDRPAYPQHHRAVLGHDALEGSHAHIV